MFLNGTNRIVYIKWEDEYLPIGCLTSDAFDEDVEMLETTTRDNAGWRTSVPTNQGYSISFDGLVKQTLIDDLNSDIISYNRLITLKRDRTLIDWKIETSDDIYISEGKGYILNISNSASIDEFINFNATIQGYGNIIETKKELIFLQSSLQTNI